MSVSMVSKLLNGWEKQGKMQSQLVKAEVVLSREDQAKIAALSEVYQLSQEQLIASLIHNTLLEVEQSMPYKAGKKIIREEEGEPIYEDVGPTPAYLRAKQRNREMALSAAS